MATCPSGHESASDDFCDVCGYLIAAPAAFGGTGAGPGSAGPGSAGPGAAGAGPWPGGGSQGTGPWAPAAPAGGGTGAARPAGQACPRCDTPRTGQFCEACGYDFSAAPPRAAAVSPPIPPVMPPPAAAPPPMRPAPAPPPSVPPPTPPFQPSGFDAAPSQTSPFQAPPVPPAARAGAVWTAVVTADRDYFDAVRAAGGPDVEDLSFPPFCPERRFQLSGPQVRIGRRSVSRGIDPEIDLTGPPADPGVSRLHAVLLAAPDGTWSVVDPGSANGTLVNGKEIPEGQAVPLSDGDRIHLGAWTALTITRDG